MKKPLRKLLLASGLLLMLGACTTPKEIAYFQDLEQGQTETTKQSLAIRVQQGDKLCIVVKSKDAQLSDLFNLPVLTNRIGQGKTASVNNNSQYMATYSVNSRGEIDFPVLGTVSVGGKTREEIAATIKARLTGENLVKDPVVTVEFDNLCYAVLGEVNSPGRFAIDRDRVSILDAISNAGDLTIYGKRKTVTVLREEGTQQKAYKIDLTSARDMLNSPAYYLKQNDVVYVEPNVTRARQSTVNGNNVLSTSFWVSVASLLTSIAVLIVK